MTGAEWDDMTLGSAHLTDWQRRSLVTDRDWAWRAARALGRGRASAVESPGPGGHLTRTT